MDQITAPAAPALCHFAPRLVLGVLNGITPALRVSIRDVCGTQHVEEAMAYVDGERGTSTRVGLRKRALRLTNELDACSQQILQ